MKLGCSIFDTVSNSSVIGDWDIESEVATNHAKRLARVLAFFNGSSDRGPVEIAQDLRPLLEDHYKFYYADVFKSHRIETLGDLIHIFDTAKSDPIVQALAESDRRELSALNIVHREAHHGQQPPPLPITSAEAKQDCGIVLKLLGRREVE